MGSAAAAGIGCFARCLGQHGANIGRAGRYRTFTAGVRGLKPHPRTSNYKATIPENILGYYGQRRQQAVDGTTQIITILILLLTMVVSVIVTQFIRRRRDLYVLRDIAAYQAL